MVKTLGLAINRELKYHHRRYTFDQNNMKHFWEFLNWPITEWEGVSERRERDGRGKKMDFEFLVRNKTYCSSRSLLLCAEWRNTTLKCFGPNIFSLQKERREASKKMWGVLLSSKSKTKKTTPCSLRPSVRDEMLIRDTWWGWQKSIHLSSSRRPFPLSSHNYSSTVNWVGWQQG